MSEEKQATSKPKPINKRAGQKMTYKVHRPNRTNGCQLVISHDYEGKFVAPGNTVRYGHDNKIALISYITYEQSVAALAQQIFNNKELEFHNGNFVTQVEIGHAKRKYDNYNVSGQKNLKNDLVTILTFFKKFHITPKHVKLLSKSYAPTKW